MHDLDWMNQAACLDRTDLDFFPEGYTDPSWEVQELCAACPVKSECLAHALKWESPDIYDTIRYRWGIWGGMSGRQRDAYAHSQPVTNDSRPGRPRTQFPPTGIQCANGHDRWTLRKRKCGKVLVCAECGRQQQVPVKQRQHNSDNSDPDQNPCKLAPQHDRWAVYARHDRNGGTRLDCLDCKIVIDRARRKRKSSI